jgi:hypothetical protein
MLKNSLRVTFLMVIGNIFPKAVNKVATVFQQLSLLISLLIQFARLFAKRFSLSHHSALYAEQYGRPGLDVTILSAIFFLL